LYFTVSGALVSEHGQDNFCVPEEIDLVLALSIKSCHHLDVSAESIHTWLVYCFFNPLERWILLKDRGPCGIRVFENAAARDIGKDHAHPPRK
jgi:hypothetical protein